MLAYAQSVLDLAAEQIAEIETLHAEALTAGAVTGRMQALIKNVVENQRSVLDYTAQAVADTYGCGTNPYWVAGKNHTDFVKRMNKELPGIVAKHPAIAAAFERHQPYRPGLGWIWHLIDLTKENKHHRLTPQTRKQDLAPQCPRHVGRGRGGGQVTHIDPTVIFIRWDFVKPNVPVLDTLHQIQAGVEAAAEDVCVAANL